MKRHYISILAFLSLGLMFVLAGGAALRESATFDEVAHIGAGLSYVQKLDLRYNAEHPPLAKVLAAIPLALRGVHADYSSTIWNGSQGFFPAFLGEWVFGEYVLTLWNNPASVLALARLPMLLLTIALGWILFLCARRIGGDWGGLLCVAVYAGTPTFLAFGPLVLTDVPVTFFTLLTLLALAQMWDSPDRRNTILVGLALGGAILSKFTAPLLFFAFIGISLSSRWLPLAAQPAGKGAGRDWRKLRWRAMRQATGWAALVVYAVYFVLSWNQPRDIPGLDGNGFFASFAGRLLMPLWIVLRGLLFVVITGSRPTFLVGHFYPHGIWFYFPVLLVLKSSLGFLGLLAASLAAAFAAKRRGWLPVIPAECATLWRVLWVSLAVFAGICIISHFDVSIRHFTIPIVLLILMLAPLPRLISRMRDAAPGMALVSGALLALLAISSLVTAVRIYPYYLPYLSPLATGHPAYWFVTDSNLDWNQALPDVDQFAQQHNIQDVPIDMYGLFESTAWVPQSRTWDCQAPAAVDAGKWVVVSANEILFGHNCKWLMQYPHESLGGGSMYAIALPVAIPEAGAPGGPPVPAERWIFIRAPFDMRGVFQRLARRPDEIPKVMAEMQEKFQKQQAGKK